MKIVNKCWLIDLDGTMYRGTQRIEGAADFIRTLQRLQIPYLFLTNNATRTRKKNREFLEAHGFTGIKEDQFFTSAMAAARYVSKHYIGRRAFMIGEAGLKEALLEMKFTLCEDHSDFVFVGLQKQGDYTLYSKALKQLLDGAVLAGTNGDRRLPDGDSYLIGNGAIVHMLAYASNKPSLNIGKPHRAMLEEALAYLHLRKEDCILLGDNLETDIALGYHNGVESVFVTSGVHNKEDIERYGIYPDHIISDIRELKEA